MKRIIVGLLFTVLACCTAQAQQNVRTQAQAVGSCGGRTLTPGVWYPVTQDLTGTLCTAGGGGGGGNVTTTPTPVTTTQTAQAPAAATFSSILASSASRKGCTIQNTGTTLGYIYFGATGSALTSNSYQVPPSGSVSCATQTGTVLTDNIAATCASGTCSFIVGAQ